MPWQNKNELFCMHNKVQLRIVCVFILTTESLFFDNSTSISVISHWHWNVYRKWFIWVCDIRYCVLGIGLSESDQNKRWKTEYCVIYFFLASSELHATQNTTIKCNATVCKLIAIAFSSISLSCCFCELKKGPFKSKKSVFICYRLWHEQKDHF